MTTDPVPETFAEARNGLFPRVLAARRTWTDPQRPEQNPVLSGSWGGPSTGVVWKGETTEHTVTWADLARWDTDSATVLKAAFDGEPEAWGSFEGVRSGTFHAASPGPAAWVLASTALRERFAVKGELAVLVPTSGEVFLTGTADLAGLTAIAQAAVEAVRRAPETAVSPELWVRDGERWRTWEWPLPRRRWGRRDDTDLGEALRTEIEAAIGPAPASTALKPPPDLAALAIAVLSPAAVRDTVGRALMLTSAGPAELRLRVGQQADSPTPLPDPLPATAGELILATGALTSPPTIAGSAARRMPPETALRAFVESSCRARGLVVPRWLGPPNAIGSLRQIDRQLGLVGQRLLVAAGPEELAYVPVRAAELAELAGREVAGVRVDDFETAFAAATRWPEVTTSAEADPAELQSWTDLASLLGLSTVGLRALGAAVADLDAFLEVHADSMEKVLWGFEPEEASLREVLIYLLDREDAAAGFARRADVDHVASSLLESPAARRAGVVDPVVDPVVEAVVEADPDGDDIDIDEKLLALQRGFGRFGVGIIALGDELDTLATYSVADRDALEDAASRAGLQVR